MKKNNPGLLVAMAFMGAIFISEALYWYLGKKLTFSEILIELGTEILTIIAVFGFALFCALIWWFVCRYLVRKR
jgi:hypothetical protein